MKTFLWLFFILFGANQIIVFAERRFGSTSQCCKATNSDGNNDFDDKMTSFTKECRQEMNIGGKIHPTIRSFNLQWLKIFHYRRSKIGGWTTILHFRMHWKKNECSKCIELKFGLTISPLVGNWLIRFNTHQINSDGSLAEDEYRNFLITELADEEYKKDRAEATITKCIEEAKAPSDIPDRILGCNTIPLRAGICISREFFKGKTYLSIHVRNRKINEYLSFKACPIEMQETSEQCVEFRRWVESGRAAWGINWKWLLKIEIYQRSESIIASTPIFWPKTNLFVGIKINLIIVLKCVKCIKYIYAKQIK